MFILKNVKFKKILNIDSLHIPAFQATCIVGESGSGKTTLLRLLNKMLSYESGEILFKNRSLKTYDAVELRRKVTMLPQVPAIFDGTIKDNLLLGLKFGGKPLVDDTKLLEVLTHVHLNKNLEQRAENLSGGEKQRLALGRLLLTDPEVLLLDEPSSALDENTEKFIIEKVVDHSKQSHKTLVMVTHSKQVADSFADYKITLLEGRVAEQKEVTR